MQPLLICHTGLPKDGEMSYTKGDWVKLFAILTYSPRIKTKAKQ